MRLDRKARRPRISGNIRGRSNEARQDAAPAECRHHFHHGLLALGLLVLGGAWFGPLPALASRAFSAHMTLHMAVVAVAAPLLAFGVSGSRLDPARRAPAIFAAVPASILELIVVWAWHTPLLHHLARGRAGMFVLEQATFLAAGLLLWLSAVGGPPDQHRSRAASGVLALLLTSMHMTLLGALLALTPRTLYPHLEGLPGLTALTDQHLGGSIMLLVGGVAYLAGGLALARELVGRSAIRPATQP